MRECFLIVMVIPLMALRFGEDGSVLAEETVGARGSGGGRPRQAALALLPGRSSLGLADNKLWVRDLLWMNRGMPRELALLTPLPV